VIKKNLGADFGVSQQRLLWRPSVLISFSLNLQARSVIDNLDIFPFPINFTRLSKLLTSKMLA